MIRTRKLAGNGRADKRDDSLEQRHEAERAGQLVDAQQVDDDD